MRVDLFFLKAPFEKNAILSSKYSIPRKCKVGGDDITSNQVPSRYVVLKT